MIRNHLSLAIIGKTMVRVVLAGCVFVIGPQAVAADIIQCSGVNANLSSTFQRDRFWSIVACPQNDNIGSPSLPYQAYVPRTVPGVWYGGNTGPNSSQGGYSADGYT